MLATGNPACAAMGPSARTAAEARVYDDAVSSVYSESGRGLFTLEKCILLRVIIVFLDASLLRDGRLSTTVRMGFRDTFQCGGAMRLMVLK